MSENENIIDFIRRVQQFMNMPENINYFIRRALKNNVFMFLVNKLYFSARLMK